MPTPPPCTGLGRQCRELTLTLRVADLREDSGNLQDAAATWLQGHTERMTFGKPFVRAGELLVEATVHVGCKYLRLDGGNGTRVTNGIGGRNGKGVHATTPSAPSPRACCAAHGFSGPMPAGTQPLPDDRTAVRRGATTFAVVFRGERRWLQLPFKRSAVRSLPVLNDNPCAGAPCRTADNTKGAACCRDLTIDVAVEPDDTVTEALLRSRQSPYLCKVSREKPETIECEVISACGYLDTDGVSCVLHDRLLPNGRLAKPSICREWPEIGEDEVAHPGCALWSG